MLINYLEHLIKSSLSFFVLLFYLIILMILNTKFILLLKLIFNCKFKLFNRLIFYLRILELFFEYVSHLKVRLFELCNFDYPSSLLIGELVFHRFVDKAVNRVMCDRYSRVFEKCLHSFLLRFYWYSLWWFLFQTLHAFDFRMN